MEGVRGNVQLLCHPSDQIPAAPLVTGTDVISQNRFPGG